MTGLRPGAFRLIHEVAVRFTDLDAAGHVHHSVPLLYWEEARIRYWRIVAGRDGAADPDYVIGQITLTYHHRIHYPATLRAGVRTTRLGRSSFDMEYALWDREDRLLCSGASTQVVYDYDAARPRPLEPETRRRIEDYEGFRGAPGPAPG
ncbi:MAG: acyl-CoA thioesterase [Gemmatimonadota bacterium]